MNEIVTGALLLGAAASCVLFLKLPARQAVIVLLVGGWAALPVAPFPEALQADADPTWFPGLATPSTLLLNKATVIGGAALLWAVVFDRRAIGRFRPGWIDAPILVTCLVPLASALRNGLPLMDGVETTVYQMLAWGGPWLVGRIYLASADALEAFALALVVAGLVYVPLCFLEFIFGPQLYGLVYGFHPYQDVGVDRYVGHRPMVFLEDGNQLGMWMATTALAAVWLWHTKALDRWRAVPAWLVVAALVGTTLLCQSVGSVFLLAAGAALLFVTSRLRSRRLIVGAIGVVCVYVVLQASGVIPIERIAKETAVGQAIKEAFEKVGRESFGWRLKLEEEYVGLAWQRPLLGWGDEDWWRQHDQTRPWGLWLLTMGRFGLVGLAALFGLLLWPCAQMIRRCAPVAWRAPPWRAAAVLTVVLIVNLGDALLNSGFILILTAAAGGIASLTIHRDSMAST